MVGGYKSPAVLLLFALCLTFGEAFFLNWGAQEPHTTLVNWAPPLKAQQPWSGQTQAYVQYQQRLLQAQQAPGGGSNELDQAQPLPMPAIPIQVPIQAQLAPAANIHNVQLVPCLCPISQADIDRAHEIYSVNKNHPHNQ